MKILVFILLLLVPTLSFADKYKHDRYYPKHYHRQYCPPNYYHKPKHHHNNNNNNDLWIGVITGGAVGYILGNTFPIQRPQYYDNR